METIHGIPPRQPRQPFMNLFSTASEALLDGRCLTTGMRIGTIRPFKRCSRTRLAHFSSPSTTNKVFSTATLLAATVAPSLLPKEASTGSSACTVRAWVRAEDLAPDHLSHGELRIKVLQPHCADSIASVALRLELNEFGEVKHLLPGAVIPEIKKTDNQTLQDDHPGWIVYDYGPYDRAMSDPALWFLKAEERTVWSTEATLFENNLNFSRPLVKPFIVASPAVNYPPSFLNAYRQLDSFDLVKRHAYSNLGYHYTAVVNFTDGRTVHLPAGYTTFRPTSTRPLAPTPSSWNTTFSMYYETCGADLPETKETLAQREKCLPESLRSAFIAEVTLEEGYTAQRGKPLKGRVTVHATNGSTQMSDISLTFHNVQSPTWAIEHATTGGDPDFYEKLCQYSHISGVISADSSSYLFSEDRSRNRFYEIPPTPHGSLTAAKPYMDFELPIPTTALPYFSSHYSSTMGALALNLAVVYPRDVANCIFGVGEAKNDSDAESIMLKTEESLWDSYTVVGNPIPPERLWERTLHLQAIVPLDVLGDISEQQMEHYLIPGQPSPIILASPPPEHVAFSFAHPVVTTEALANTSARLMSSKGTFDPYQYERDFADYYNWQEAVPDPAAHYNEGNYAGLLWKKKVAAEERGILPKTSTTQGEGNDGDSQHPFVVMP